MAFFLVRAAPGQYLPLSARATSSPPANGPIVGKAAQWKDTMVSVAVLQQAAGRPLARVGHIVPRARGPHALRVARVIFDLIKC